MKTYVSNVLGRWTVKILVVNAGERLSNQRHQHRSERWLVLSGSPVVVIEFPEGNARSHALAPGRIMTIGHGAWHRLSCPASSQRPCKILEISKGFFSEEDIERSADDYGRV